MRSCLAWRAEQRHRIYLATGTLGPLARRVAECLPITVKAWAAELEVADGRSTGELTGGFFTQLINLIERFGRVHGAAFPSAHVSGSLVALLGAWRYRRWLFWMFLPFFLSMLVSTVYGRYHYVADVLGGLVTGAIGFWLGHALMERQAARPRTAQ
jgi:membrane-associated phospholipid phosphatase